MARNPSRQLPCDRCFSLLSTVAICLYLGCQSLDRTDRGVQVDFLSDFLQDFLHGSFIATWPDIFSLANVDRGDAAVVVST